VLLAQVGKLLKNKTDADKLAIAQQNLGHVDLDSRVDLPDEAVANYQAALDHWKSKSPGNALDPTIEDLISKLMEARLRAHQYPEAVKFAAQTIAEHKDTADAFGKTIIQEVDRLNKSSDQNRAIELIKATLPLPLGDLDKQRLQVELSELTNQAH
jgi:hypothetical protein